MKKILILFFIFFATTFSVQSQDLYLTKCNQIIIEAIMEDIFPPPVASRIHMYSNLAAYEVLAQKYKTLKPLAGQIKHLEAIPIPKTKVDYSVSAEIAMLEVGKKLIYSDYLIDDFVIKELELKSVELNDKILLDNSITYGREVAAHLLAWIAKDNYVYTRTLVRYVLNDSLGAWKPTAPEYMNGLEPNWYLIRSLTFDSTSFIRALPNTPYSENKKSLYYKNAKAVYDVSQAKDSTKINTALYWDDNPNTAVVKGHLTYFIHKVTPGGHWLKMTGQAIRKYNLSEDKAAEVYAMVSIAIFEGFLNAWNEKYKSNSIRPETYINRVINAKWLPLIETPPFPEYTSAHSVISSAAAYMLTSYIPKPHSFIDSSQLYLSMTPRSFPSFIAASEEASVSRFYGGIHFMPSLNNGLAQGKKVTEYILNHIHTRQ